MPCRRRCQNEPLEHIPFQNQCSRHHKARLCFAARTSVFKREAPCKPFVPPIDRKRKPLEFKLVFGAERELDRYELEDIAYWLTGRKEYKWLSIGQQDMEQLQFRCMVTELTPISHGWLPVAFQATIQCDCPYAYSYPFEKQYTISGETTILFRNESSVREYLKPEISFAPASSTRTLSLVNLNDDNREFKLSVNLDNYSTTEQMNEAIATAIANKVDKVDGKGLSTEDFTTALKEKLVALPEGAEANYVKSVSDEFTVSAEGKLEVKEVAPAKVTGLPDALAGKVDKVAGKGLSANDYTNEEKEKLGGVEAGANKNLIEIIKLAGAALNISEKAVNIPFAGDTAGVVTSSTGENKVAVAEDGSMEVNSLNMNKLVQSDGDTLILDGGNAAV